MKKIVAKILAPMCAAMTLIGCGGAEEESTQSTDDTLIAATEETTVNVSCGSQFFQRKECAFDNQGGRVVGWRITDEFSNPPFLCRRDDSHGVTQSYVWVDKGCGAAFEVRIQRQTAPARERIRCESNDGRYRVCESRIRDIRSIRLIRQESDRPCDEGRSFGAYEDAIWVDRGCRGVFEVSGRDEGPSGGARIELYDRENFNGNTYAQTQAVRNLSSVGYNDRAESIIVRSGNWEVCEHENFSGLCTTYRPGRYDRLGPLAGRITSIRPR